MNTIIAVENLSKKYIIYHLSQRGTQTLKETVSAWGRTLGQKLLTRNLVKDQAQEELWALKNINFEVHPGDRLGIIGRNGSGKSTLLKILSRIKTPTAGRAHIRGRVSSLLEVGTGFHHELTGRENIYLSGAILGISHREMKKNFDEIVAFAETERFLDTPVKRYSSGMYVRLAFSVAAHLTSEILLVDEVLSVGDFAFQNKCLAKMNALSKEGRTILFVSHNLSTVEQFCHKAMLLDGGLLKTFQNDVSAVINLYLYGDAGTESKSRWENTNNAYENPWFQPQQLYLGDSHGQEIMRPIRKSDEVWLYITGRIQQPSKDLQLGYTLRTRKGYAVYSSFHSDALKTTPFTFAVGIATLRSQIPITLLNDGSYTIELTPNLKFQEWLCRQGPNPPRIPLTILSDRQTPTGELYQKQGVLTPGVVWEQVPQR